MRKPICKRFGVDFHSPGGALTLNPAEVTEQQEVTGTHTRKHADGWTITGEVIEDYFYWVNDFKASHPKLGRVWGNFEGEVWATSERAFRDFYKHHTAEAWDYQDI